MCMCVGARELPMVLEAGVGRESSHETYGRSCASRIMNAWTDSAYHKVVRGPVYAFHFSLLSVLLLGSFLLQTNTLAPC